jgi:hypothetical protein
MLTVFLQFYLVPESFIAPESHAMMKAQQAWIYLSPGEITTK